jgi:hypothetical protein
VAHLGLVAPASLSEHRAGATQPHTTAAYSKIAKPPGDHRGGFALSPIRAVHPVTAACGCRTCGMMPNTKSAIGVKSLATMIRH